MKSTLLTQFTMVMQTITACCLLACTLVLALPGRAAPVTAKQAQAMAERILANDPNPLGSGIGTQVTGVTTYTGADKAPLYYVVHLRPRGYLIMSADDLLDPVIAFVERGNYDPASRSALPAMVQYDLPHRLKAARALAAGVQSRRVPPARATAITRAQQQWAPITRGIHLLKGTGNSSMSEVRVAPLTASTWDQATLGNCTNGAACYNYYTPSSTTNTFSSPGDATNDVCGCVATAMAHLMCYWQYPTSAVDTTISYTCSAGVDQQSQDQTKLKEKLIGNPATWGGAYDWGNMPLSLPFGTIEDASVSQCQAIGALCHDAGVANGAAYSSGSGTSAYVYNAGITLKSTFYFSNCIDAQPTGSTFNEGADLYNILNPNLDAGFPLIFGIHNSTDGHCIVCDGYGYESSTLYYHLNMGWSGNDNAWYELPDIDCPDEDYDYPFLTDILYNTSPMGGGEIISGRVVDQNGMPIIGAAVQCNGPQPNLTWTNDQGIFAFPNLSSNAFYFITATFGNGFSVPLPYLTATSTYG